jgi:hypothetical protein
MKSVYMNSFQLYRIINDYNENQRLYHENVRRMFSYLEQTNSRATFSTTTNSPRSRNTTGAANIGNITDRIVYYLLRGGGGGINSYAETNPAPTQDQITRSTENLNYSAAIHRENVCPISLETFQEGEDITRIRHCGHIFRRNDLSRWFLQHSVCPVCRYNIMEPSIATTPTARSSSSGAATTNIAENTEDTETATPSTEVSSFLSQLMNLFDTSASTLRAGDSGELIFEIPLAYYPITGGITGAVASVAAEMDAAAAASIEMEADLEVD